MAHIRTFMLYVRTYNRTVSYCALCGAFFRLVECHTFNNAEVQVLRCHCVDKTLRVALVDLAK